VLTEYEYELIFKSVQNQQASLGQQSTITGLDWWTGLVGWTGGLIFFCIKNTFMLSKQTHLPAMPCIVAWCATITRLHSLLPARTWSK